MKPLNKENICLSVKVAPRAGAWIETFERPPATL